MSIKHTNERLSNTAVSQSNTLTDTYLVATNPDLAHPQHRWLHVLFSGESQTKPAHKQGPKLYDFYLMHLIIEGKGYFETQRGRYQLQRGDLFLIRPQQLITYEACTKHPWHYVWIAFNGEQVEALLEAAGFTLHRDVLAIQDIEFCIAQCQAIYEAFKQMRQPATLVANGLFHLMLASLQTEQQQALETSNTMPIHNEHSIAKQIVQYLTTQYAHPVSIEVMADTLGYNRAYLSRLFKHYTGISPRTYLLHYRLDQAKHLLRARPDLTIEQVSASVGIQDSLYFSKQFKKYTKQTPTSYRTQLFS